MEAKPSCQRPAASEDYAAEARLSYQRPAGAICGVLQEVSTRCASVDSTMAIRKMATRCGQRELITANSQTELPTASGNYPM